MRKHILVFLLLMSSALAQINNGGGGGGAPTGPAGGDLTGTFPNPGVGQINGAAVPTSASVLGSNGSNQLVTSTAHSLSVVHACEAASASGTAYTCTTSPSFTPADLDVVLFETDVANTGSATLAVNGATAATIKKQGGGTNLVANDLLANQWTWVVFDGTNWQMQGPLGNAAGAGTVTSFSAGTLSPLFTTSVATATTTPALTFTLSNAGAGTVFGNPTGAAAAPVYTSVPVLGLAGTTVGTLGFQNATSGTVTLSPVTGALGTVTINLPAAAGTVAVSATSPVTESAAGAVGCATCTTNASALTSNSVVLGGGGQAAATNAGFTTDGTSKLTLGVAGTSTGNLILASSTATGSVALVPASAASAFTVTFPAATDTVDLIATAQTLSSKTLSAPSFTGQSLFPAIVTCASPEISITGNTTLGLSNIAVGIMGMCSGGSLQGGWKGGGINVSGGNVFGSSTNSANLTTIDTGITRFAAGVWQFGNGTANDETALLRWNTCKPTSAINLTAAGGSTTICSFTLPTGAKTWSWNCNGTYSVSAGTTPTFGLGMNAAQAPTSETGSASIDTTLTGTSTQGTVTSTSSGNQSILTGGTLTTVTNAWWSTFGTIQASATTGTFAITGIVVGTSAVGTVNVGSSCMLY